MRAYGADAIDVELAGIQPGLPRLPDIFRRIMQCPPGNRRATADHRIFTGVGLVDHIMAVLARSEESKVIGAAGRYHPPRNETTISSVMAALTVRTASRAR